ncbi:MAG TPA: 50S ribosomal protein L2 [Methanomassiliicoccales archaeon]|nr:50S ribosomal protein L2 [Methanomassiliicoccales archaeon]
MGRRLRQQRRGHGSSTYRSPSHRHVGEIKHPHSELKNGVVTDIIHAPGRNSPVAEIKFESGKKDKIIAVEGLMVGQDISVDGTKNLKPGSILPLSNIPEGTLIHNLEARPGDGGKFVRTAGTYATLVTKGDTVVVQLPSGAFKNLDPRCRAGIGIIAGGGASEKPFAKAGKKFHALRSKAKANFKVKGVAMNAVDHPHGGGGHPHVGKPSTVSRNAPPGRKVGRLSPQKKQRK